MSSNVYTSNMKKYEGKMQKISSAENMKEVRRNKEIYAPLYMSRGTWKNYGHWP